MDGSQSLIDSKSCARGRSYLRHEALCCRIAAGCDWLTAIAAAVPLAGGQGKQQCEEADAQKKRWRR